MKDHVQKAIEEGKMERKHILVDCTAPWCSACRSQDSIIERVRETLKDVVVTILDVEERPEVAESYDILSLPAILIFDPNGRLRWRSAGKIVPFEEIVKVVKGIEQDNSPRARGGDRVDDGSCY
ncbi:MAG: thioredoxin family protein [Candidatus Heimdallarchaeota archaeon]